MSDKKLHFYNLIILVLVSNFITRVCNGNILLSIVSSIVVFFLLFRVIKIETYIKKYLIK